MAKIKSMIKTTLVEIAQRKRTCKNTQGSISKGELCIVISEGQFDRSCYSKDIGLKMVLNARTRLSEIEQQLLGKLPPDEVAKKGSEAED